MSRAAVDRDPSREVFRGISARSWFADGGRNDPPAQGGALFRRGDIDAAIARGATMSPAERDAMLRAIRPDPVRDIGRAFAGLDESARTAGESVRAWVAEMERLGALGRERERARRRAAQYEREAPWRARILASIPESRHITAAELRARVVLPTLRERLAGAA